MFSFSFSYLEAYAVKTRRGKNKNVHIYKHVEEHIYIILAGIPGIAQKFSE